MKNSTISKLTKFTSKFGKASISKKVETIKDLDPEWVIQVLGLDSSVDFNLPYYSALEEYNDQVLGNEDCEIPPINSFTEPKSRMSLNPNCLPGLEREEELNQFNFSKHSIHAGLIKISHQAICNISEYIGPALAAISRGGLVWNTYPSIVSKSTVIGKRSSFYKLDSPLDSELASIFPPKSENLYDSDDEDDWTFPPYSFPAFSFVEFEHGKAAFLSKLHYEIHNHNTGIIVIDDLEKIFLDLSVKDPDEQEDFIKRVGILAEAYRIPILVVDPNDKVPEYAWHMHWKTATEDDSNGDRYHQLWVTSKIENDIPNPVLNILAIPVEY